MTVAQIIEEKGGAVVTTAPKSSLAEVAAMLSEKRIGAVLVTEGEAIRGIISERDVVRALAKHGSEALRMLASECMTEKVITCRLEDSMHDVMQQMTNGRFRHVPVVESGKLVGIISVGDVVKRRIAEVEREADQIREYIAMA